MLQNYIGRQTHERNTVMRQKGLYKERKIKPTWEPEGYLNNFTKNAWGKVAYVSKHF